MKEIITKEVFDGTLFKVKNELYTYEGFLKAVSKFPAFCDDNALDGWDDKEVCKKELATLFAHFVQETSKNSGWDVTNLGIELWQQGLYFKEYASCNTDAKRAANDCTFGYWDPNSWANKAEAWPQQSGKLYYGRGPL